MCFVKVLIDKDLFLSTLHGGTVQELEGGRAREMNRGGDEVGGGQWCEVAGALTETGSEMEVKRLSLLLSRDEVMPHWESRRHGTEQLGNCCYR